MAGISFPDAETGPTETQSVFPVASGEKHIVVHSILRKQLKVPGVQSLIFEAFIGGWIHRDQGSPSTGTECFLKVLELISSRVTQNLTAVLAQR
jgi:hypothetical protein